MRNKYRAGMAIASTIRDSTPRMMPGVTCSKGNPKPVTLVRTVVARKSAVMPSSRLPPNIPNNTTKPEAMPIRLMITWIKVYLARDMPKTIVGLLQNFDFEMVRLRSANSYQDKGQRERGFAARRGEALPLSAMLPFKLIYTDDYYLPIGAHVFPAEKYRLIHKRLLESRMAEPDDFIAPKPAHDEDILLVHTREYVHKLKTGTLSQQEERQMEGPYSPELVKAFWLAAGGSILAADMALRDGIACNIGGGFHHAFPDHGEGFCVIHDVAVAIKRTPP